METTMNEKKTTFYILSVHQHDAEMNFLFFFSQIISFECGNMKFSELDELGMIVLSWDTFCFFFTVWKKWLSMIKANTCKSEHIHLWQLILDTKSVWTHITYGLKNKVQNMHIQIPKFTIILNHIILRVFSVNF